ncbi:MULTISPECIES: polysaccharide deacetylase family protein [Bacillus cereus group]|uniref:polysaccharide deacetylase family protein n=1 Tax=Bacillus cereus group TaxID=86661 RepID=UPI0013D012BE|nr:MULTISPECIES: polysaccharide deacetylase family protein [Bacillus cereus group]MDA2290561.1 polysaccharide deacetylase family protein [Bacillus cereus group sp. Bc191]MDR0169669.1 polysaccharide deacetylase family protein [Bacillus paranthracis]QRH08296.1 polysaccharide deacetylase family protein [Bacillus paranthracis]
MRKEIEKRLSDVENTGIFTVSLDFELYWGMFDKIVLEDYKENLAGVHQVVPRMLNLFEEYGIHVTWATVGLLFFKDYSEMIENLPKIRPNYTEKQISAYNYIDKNNHTSIDTKFHYASSLINKIKQTPFQEIGTHTFSHYYCLEEGQSTESFQEDLNAAIEVANKKNIPIKSIVFPRNQVNQEYLQVCLEHGIAAYRGTENVFIYNAEEEDKKNTPIKRILRLLDAYFNIFGHNTYALSKVSEEKIINIPASRFYRPYSRRLRKLEPLKINRILNDMEYAAKRSEIYHLWWHPHNFGGDIEENIKNLQLILEKFKFLKEKYNMRSLNMGEISNEVKKLQ